MTPSLPICASEAESWKRTGERSSRGVEPSSVIDVRLQDCRRQI